MKLQITLLRLRRASLHGQGLSKAQPFGTGKAAVLRALEHLGYVQIDTLSVVERAHHHTLWSRIPSYKPEYLEKLIQDRSVFEYWSHAAAFLPMRDYRFALPRMESVRRGESRWLASVTRNDEDEVLARIRAEGALMARAFDSPKEHPGSWWNWKPAKKTLEKLFFQGDLMITNRSGMQKVYDLRERVLPDTVDTREPTLDEYANHLIDSSLTAHNFTTLKQVMHLRRGDGLRALTTNLLKERVNAGQLAEFVVEGLPIIYASPDLIDKKMSTVTKTVRFLSPFDNAVIHRHRIQQTFGFDYGIECYMPASKRQFGYFCLPILYGDEIIGRVDCKSDRRRRQLELIHLHIESTIRDRERFVSEFKAAGVRFALFNGCDSCKITRTNPPQWNALLRGSQE